MLTAVSGTIFIAAGAFWLSFTSLADLAARSGVGHGQAWAWPLIVDGVIVVSTVAVVALAGERGAWYPWTLLAGAAAASVTANSIHAVVDADADVPGVLAACVAAVPPVVLLAITHLTVVLARAQHVDLEVSLAVAADPPAALVPFGPVPAMAGRAELPNPARAVADASAGVDRRRVAEGLRGAGWSNKKIARHLEVAPSTVGRWFTKPTPDLADQQIDVAAEERPDGPARPVPRRDK